MAWDQKKIEQVIQEIKKRAAIDKEFREKLLKDARAAIEEVAGEKIPENLKIQVVEQDPTANITLTIPPFKGEELSDEDLDQVAGGGLGAAGILCIGVGACLGELDTSLVPCGGEVCGGQASVK